MGAEYIACSVLSLVLYWNTLTADFCYDDSRAIQKNPDLLPETPISQLFYNDFWGTPLTHSGSHKSYRPLCVLTFRLNYILAGLNPLGFHLLNILLHCAVSALYCYCVRILTHKRSVAVTAGLLFAAHPIHTEAVAGLVGRADVLACLFFLLSFLCYINYCNIRDSGGPGTRHRWLYLLTTGACSCISMLCKEQGVTVLAVCVMYDVFVCHRITWQHVFKCLYQSEYRRLREGMVFIALCGAALLTFRLGFMGNKPPEFAPADNPASDSSSIITRTLTFVYLPVVNFWLLLFPKTLSFDWSMEAVPLLESIYDARNILSVIFYTAVIYLLNVIIVGYEQYPIVLHSQPYDNHCHSNQNNGHVNNPVPNGKHAVTNGKHSPSNGKHTVSNGKHSVSNGKTVIANGTHSQNSNSAITQTWTGPTRRRSNRFSSSSSSCSSDNDQEPSCRKIFDLNALNSLTISLSMMIFPFIPATNIFFYVGFVIAERVLYIPSMGFCLLVSHGAHILYNKLEYKQIDRRKKKEGIGGKIVFVILGIVLILYSARTVIRNWDWGNEENLYKSGLDVNPAKAWGNLANILNNQGKLSEAEAAYHEALKHRGNMADVHYNLGILLQEQKRYTEAVEAYKNAIDCRPRLTMAHLNLGIVLGLLKRVQEAEQVYRHCADIDISGLKDPRLHENTKISALYNLGRLLADQDRLQESIDVYHTAISRMPSHYAPQSLYNMLGEAYARLDRSNEAELWYTKALHAKPDHIPAHLTMARLYHKKGKSEEADRWFVKAMRLSPDDSAIYQHYGQFLGDLGQHREAAEKFIRASELAPHDFELLFNAANALRQANLNYDAEEYYKKAAKLNPGMATAHMNLGAMLHYNGKLEEAEASYLRALELKPDDVVTQTNLKKLRNLLRKSSKENRA